MCLGSLQFSVLGEREKRVAHAGGVQGDIPSLHYSCLLTGDSWRRRRRKRWKRKPCFSLLPSRVNHAPTTAIRFSSLQGCWCGAERASLDVPVSEEKGGLAGLGQGQRPKEREGAGEGPFLLLRCCHYIFST